MSSKINRVTDSIENPYKTQQKQAFLRNVDVQNWILENFVQNFLQILLTHFAKMATLEINRQFCHILVQFQI